MTTRSPVELVDKSGNRAGNVVINTVHYEVHKGKTFRAWYIVPHASPIADNAFVDIVLTTGAEEAHIVFSFGLGGDAEFNLYRTPNFEADGTPFTPYNLKDASSIAALSAISINPTINTVGTEIDGEFLPGGSGGNAQGGAIRDEAEDILKINTSYLIRLTNRAGNAKQFSIELQWFEETPA